MSTHAARVALTAALKATGRPHGHRARRRFWQMADDLAYVATVGPALIAVGLAAWAFNRKKEADQ